MLSHEVTQAVEAFLGEPLLHGVPISAVIVAKEVSESGVVAFPLVR